MTPEPTYLLRGARRTLEDVVLPAIDDPFAIEQAKTIARVLMHLEAVIDVAYPLEAAEADDLCRFLGEAGAPPAELPSYRELRDGNVARKRRLSGVVRELASGTDGADRRAALDELLRRQLERERRWTRPRRAPK
jgi:hypothetical protein